AMIRPTGYATFGRPIDIALIASASDTSATIAKVDFFVNNELLGTGTGSGTNQYSLTWNNAASGTHAITAVATDNAGITTTSVPISVSVFDPPSIRIDSPANGAQIIGSAYTPANSVTFKVSASSYPAGIELVEFYANGALVGATRRFGSSQFTFTWSGMPLGAYTLTAVATATSGLTATSALVSIVVNSPPTISLNSPTSGTTYNAPASITMTANASDSDGRLARLIFLSTVYSLGQVP
ncbi:MAG TPA: Ig-like domain-containing protein, partial [Pyrinomonadaceae bacterium]|nr:Ig-like domain-containing protein [Pyrinomonadaceae bacterium]